MVKNQESKNITLTFKIPISNYKYRYKEIYCVAHYFRFIHLISSFMIYSLTKTIDYENNLKKH